VWTGHAPAGGGSLRGLCELEVPRLNQYAYPRRPHSRARSARPLVGDLTASGRLSPPLPLPGRRRPSSLVVHWAEAGILLGEVEINAGPRLRSGAGCPPALGRAVIPRVCVVTP
jgi:hypothetical protein